MEVASGRNSENLAENTRRVTEDDLVAFVTRQASREQRERVKAALADPGSEANQWLQSVRMAAADPFGIDLGKLIEMTENEPRITKEKPT